VQLGFENRKKVIWASIFSIVAVLAFAYEVIPMFTGSTTQASSASVGAPIAAASHSQSRPLGKGAKKPEAENLDPTLRLDLLALSEKTLYEGNGRNIFVSHAEDIPQPKRSGATDAIKPEDDPNRIYQIPRQPSPPPIPLKFYGFASSPGEPKRIFLKSGEDVFVAGEGEIVDRRYKVVRITNTTVDIQDLVSSGPPQTIPLTQG